MKIYFAGSIRGGREDIGLYAQIIKMLQKYGEVLTEHVADPNLTANGELNLNDEQIYIRDTDWIKESDLIVAEVTHPSLGVGYELGLAEKLGIKTICLYRSTPNTRLSAMIRGNKSYQVNDYKEISEVPEILLKYFRSLI